MQTNAAGVLASLSGATSMPFGSQRDLELQVNGFANDLANRYLLSFQPNSSREGLHELQLSVPAQPGLRVASRNGYWRTRGAKP